MRPFNPDKNRGTWSSPVDFIFACVSHAFTYDVMFFLGSIVSIEYFSAYSISLILCTFPLIMIQSYLGQFSSSGFISAFRIAPIFKCLGYVSLAVNLLTLTFYSLNAAIPVFFMVHSFRSILPWSCEGINRWMPNTDDVVLSCNLTDGKIHSDRNGRLVIPSHVFFSYQMSKTVVSEFDNFKSLLFSWPLMVCNLFVWLLVWSVLTKRTEKIGQILRYSTGAAAAILFVCVARLGFLPGAMDNPTYWPEGSISTNVRIVALVSLGGLGPGWGSILSMASYNEFKNDVFKQSWMLCLGQMGLLILVCLARQFVVNFWMSMTTSGWTAMDYPFTDGFWTYFLTVPSTLVTLEVPQFWSILFFVMITVGLTNMIVVQLFSVVTSLFDEFESLRKSRSKVILLLTAALCICSTIFCTNWGLISLGLLFKFTIFTQVALNFMMLVVVMWVYGHERFQRDFLFMTERSFHNWFLYIPKFVSPVFLLICAGITVLFIFLRTSFRESIVFLLLMIAILPWTMVPIYCCLKAYRTRGTNIKWHQDGTRPNDWHPVDAEDKKGYQECLGIRDPSHPLAIIAGEA